MRWTARLLSLLLLVSTGPLGCSALSVDPFTGSWIAMSLLWPSQSGDPPQPVLLMPGQRLELWAQLGGGQIVRLVPDDILDFQGFDVRWVVEPNDPCLIRALNPEDPCAREAEPAARCGAHLLSSQGTPFVDSKDWQIALVQRLRQVLPTSVSFRAAGDARGAAPAPLLVAVEHDRPCAPGEEACALTLTADNAGPGAEAARRRDLCVERTRRHPAYYVGNPWQFTKPFNGHLYGFFSFQAAGPDIPTQSLGGIALTTAADLRDLQGLFATIETEDSLPMPNQPRGTRVLTGTILPRERSGRGALRLALSTMVNGQPVLIGSASILTALDQEIP